VDKIPSEDFFMLPTASSFAFRLPMTSNLPKERLAA